MAETLKETVKEALNEVVNKAEEVVKATKVDISTEDKLLVRTIETEFLKGQMELQRLSVVVKDASDRYTKALESFGKKYAFEPLEYAWDSLELAFKKK